MCSPKRITVHALVGLALFHGALAAPVRSSGDLYGRDARGLGPRFIIPPRPFPVLPQPFPVIPRPPSISIPLGPGPVVLDPSVTASITSDVPVTTSDPIPTVTASFTSDTPVDTETPIATSTAPVISTEVTDAVPVETAVFLD
ncbi:hypothetical protein BC826DRAFT_38924 [Russula brevipes]|nr:hypothetical protein BC826DRAFT_38924 [Russula brevipes]